MNETGLIFFLPLENKNILNHSPFKLEENISPPVAGSSGDFKITFIMNRQSIHQQIELLLKALATHHDQFRDGKGNIPQVELDLMLQNTRQLYEAILMLNHTNALTSLDEVKAAVTQRILAEKKMFERKTEELNHQREKEQQQPEANPVPKAEDVHPSAVEEVMVKAMSAAPAEDKKEKPVKSRKLSGGVNATLFGETHTFAEHFTDEETLHEHIAGKAASPTVAENLHRKPIRDLKAAIGINEKFLFINQLFEGNLQEYSEAVDKLNQSADLVSAKKYITGELAGRFNWSDRDEHVKNFIELVERRFIQ